MSMTAPRVNTGLSKSVRDETLGTKQERPTTLGISTRNSFIFIYPYQNLAVVNNLPLFIRTTALLVRTSLSLSHDQEPSLSQQDMFRAKARSHWLVWTVRNPGKLIVSIYAV